MSPYADGLHSVITQHRKVTPIVYGRSNEKVREKLLRDKGLTLAKAEQVCKAVELAAAQKEVWTQERQVDPVKESWPTRERRTEFRCSRCGRIHAPRSCPAFGRICRKCGGENHFAVRCKSARKVSEVRSGDHEDDFNILNVSNGKHQRDWMVPAQVGSTPVYLKVDTGAQANLLPYGTYQRLRPKAQLKASNSVLRSYVGEVIKHLGIATLKTTIGDQVENVDFFIVKKGRQAILGLHASELLGLFTRSVNVVTTNSSEQLAQAYRDVFQGTGCVKREYRMVLRKGAIRSVQTPRRVPLALQKPLKEELERMLKAGIITKVEEPTDWVSPLVIITNNGKLRICMDPRRINECLKREHYQMPRREDIEAELAGAKFFHI
ncbi:uncharacterized protein LOC125939845 [Dermacentor silvarum]|uniref:uncharacterized protein LOC125939845 n=1 Tax=Dermacentor silvarum TaxID=543639 RepID=UPI00210152EC|nr:uncharacterized protein LOC125939845 [Dermacentor silvarum]